MRRSFGPVLALIVLTCLATWRATLEAHQPKPNDYGQPAQAEHQDRPIAKMAVAPHKEEDQSGGEQEGDVYSILQSVFLEHVTDWLLALFTFFLVVYTARLYRATAGLVASAREQGEDMKSSIAEAARSAGAIEIVGNEFAASVRNQLVGMANYQKASQLQLRAYVVVYIGTAFAQNRERDIHFQIKPNIINAGFTPARKVRWAIRCDIAPYPLPRDFELEEPEVNPDLGTMNMGPHQTLSISGIFPEFVEGEEAVSALKAGVTERLYVWGTIHYEDVFEQEQHTRFCHSVAWAVNEDGTETIDGDYPGRHNEAT